MTNISYYFTSIIIVCCPDFRVVHRGARWPEPGSRAVQPPASILKPQSDPNQPREQRSVRP